MQKRILIKLSGESFLSDGSSLSRAAIQKITNELKELQEAGYQVGVVLGGGNFFRGILAGQESLPIRRAQADQIGMYATLMNGLLLSEALLSENIPHKLLSSIPSPFIESFTQNTMQQSLANDGIVLFVGGTGHPYFTTDTAAALRATEMGAGLLLKATTKVDGVYNKDPRKHKDAVKYERLTYQKALDEKLQILDLTAFALCMENKIAIRVYKYEEHSFLHAIQNNCGSLVTGVI